MAERRLTAASALRDHWPEYLIEGWALATFIFVAGTVAVLLSMPGVPLHPAIPAAVQLRVFAGLALGCTAVLLIHTPWGKRSGAHLNPAVTLTFWRLGKVKTWDAVFYVAAQLTGAVIAIHLLVWLFGSAFTEPPVRYIVTLPAGVQPWIAFSAEVAISAGMMGTVLILSASRRWASLTGFAAGGLVATFIILESPVSGMSMNPARSLASNGVAMQWRFLWIYLTAPPLGMLGAAAVVSRLGGPRTACAKLLHPADQRCIHCGYEPERVRHDAAYRI